MKKKKILENGAAGTVCLCVYFTKDSAWLKMEALSPSKTNTTQILPTT